MIGGLLGEKGGGSAQSAVKDRTAGRLIGRHDRSINQCSSRSTQNGASDPARTCFRLLLEGQSLLATSFQPAVKPIDSNLIQTRNGASVLPATRSLGACDLLKPLSVCLFCFCLLCGSIDAAEGFGYPVVSFAGALRVQHGAALSARVPARALRCCQVLLQLVRSRLPRVASDPGGTGSTRLPDEHRSDDCPLARIVIIGFDTWLSSLTYF